MANPKIVDGSMTSKGLRRIRLVRMGEPIQRYEYLQVVPGEVPYSNVLVDTHYDNTLDIHRVDLSWMAREVVRRAGHPLEVWWWLGGMTISFGMECAACLLFEKTGEEPVTGLVQKLPKIHEKQIEVEYRDHVFRLDVVADELVPYGFVIARGRK